MPNIKKFEQFGRFGLVTAVVASYIFEGYLKNESEAFQIDLDTLAADIGARGADVRKSCMFLSEKGILQIDGTIEDWDDVGTIGLCGIGLKCFPDQLTLTAGATQHRIDRIQLGFEEVVSGEDVYRCSVRAQVDGDEHTGWWELNAAKNPDQENEELIATNKEFESRDDAWEWWDEFIRDFRPTEDELTDDEDAKANDAEETE